MSLSITHFTVNPRFCQRSRLHQHVPPPPPSHQHSRFRLLSRKDQLVVTNSEIFFLIAIFWPHMSDVKQR